MSNVPESPGYELRTHSAGDIGWVIHRHGVIYAEEFGWDIRFEGLVAEVLGKFIRDYDSSCERSWIAVGGPGFVASGSGFVASDSGFVARRSPLVTSFLGCVFLVKVDNDASSTMRTCKLRCLLVEPGARGMGLGGRLVDESIVFARSCGYERMVLWTNDVLVGARKIYESRGFRMIEEKPHSLFARIVDDASSSSGVELIGQTWELVLV